MVTTQSGHWQAVPVRSRNMMPGATHQKQTGARLLPGDILGQLHGRLPIGRPEVGVCDDPRLRRHTSHPVRDDGVPLAGHHEEGCLYVLVGGGEDVAVIPTLLQTRFILDLNKYLASLLYMDIWIWIP